MENLNTRSWADLPMDLALKIAGEHIEFYEDFEAFGKVCWNWRHAMKSSNSQAPSRHTPWLMLAEPPRTLNRRFYNLRNGIIRHVELPEPPLLYNHVNGDQLNLERLFDVEDDEDKGGWRYFSSNGWLISVTQFNFNITLVNPFTGQSIQAPRAPYHIMQTFQGNWDEYYYLTMFRKFCLSHSPSPSFSSDKDDFTLAMLCEYSKLFIAFWRSGDDDWTLVDFKIPLIDTEYSDVIYYKDEFYCITYTGLVHALGKANAIGSSYPPPSPRVVADLDWPVYDLFRVYLVESNGSLLVVFRQPLYPSDPEDPGYDDDFYETHYFNVWEVNVESGEVKQVNNLGNRALFLGWNSSFSLEASPARGCLPNCIYYTDDFADFYTHNNSKFGGSDMGVYDLTSRCKIHDHYDGPSRFSNITPPFWLQPSHPFLQEAK